MGGSFGFPSKIDEKKPSAWPIIRSGFCFLARAGISTIAVYETATYTMVKELDFGDKFEWVGNHAFQRGRLRLSSDGKLSSAQCKEASLRRNGTLVDPTRGDGNRERHERVL